MTKIITFSASKGGVGKTTMTFNFGAYLNKQGYSVLLIDSDYQGNLSSTYGVYSSTNTLFDVFTGGQPKIRQINDQLGILPASPNLDQLEALLQGRNNQNFLMLMWLQDHAELVNHYDFVLIDTHPEFGTLTKNMIAISDHVIVPLEPSEYGFVQSKSQFEIRFKEFQADAVDIRTRISLIDAQVHYLANRVKFNTRSSREFASIIADLDDVVATIYERELFNTSTMLKTPIFELKNDNKKALAEIENAFVKLLESVK
ncbi:ParA family protein [Leuconostoc pseudomesenteroides]|uniref:ParA family protein n=1 Tax=Leuconostoc pseudomesenteroides TaxID=33968 RepID=UPI0039ED487C